MPHVTVEMEGDDALIRARAQGGRFVGRVRDLMEEAGRIGEAEMLAKVPRSNDPDASEGSIAQSIRATEPIYHPGGAGGGGTWEMRVGPDEERAPSHLRYVLEGTGVFGPNPHIITPHEGGVLAIRKKGEGVHFRMWSLGQQPQTEWLDDGIQAAERHVAVGIYKLGWNTA